MICRRCEAFKGDQSTGCRAQRQAMGGRLRLSRGDARSGSSRRSFRSEQRPDAGLGVQSASRRSSRTSGCGGPSIYAFDFEERTAAVDSANTSATTAISTASEFMVRACPKARSWRFWRPLRDKVPPEVFTTPYQNPVNGNPESVRNNLREATRLLKEAGFEIKRPQAGRPQRASRSASKSCAGIRAMSGSRCSTSRGWSGSASPPAFAPSTTCSIRTACAVSTSI